MKSVQTIWLALDSRSNGGIESHVAELAMALAQQGFAVTVVLLADYGSHPLETRLRQDGVNLIKLNGRPWSLFTALQSALPDILHTHGYKAGILGRLYARLLRIAVVSTFHAGEIAQGRLRYYQRLDELSAPLAPTMAVSEAIASRLGCQVAVVDNFVAVPQLTARIVPRTVAFVGRFSHEKAPDRFITIARLLPDVSFLMFGDGPLRTELECNAPSNVRFMGMVPSMQPYWSEIGLLCMPSRYEGLPMAALEAMAHGVVVASFAVGGVPRLRLGGAGGYLCPESDMAALSANVISWSRLTSARRQLQAERARQRILQGFTAAAVLPAILQVYASAKGVA